MKDIRWAIEEGEHWLLFGLNGCGKTTLLSILAGYADGDTGDIELFSQALNGENIMALRSQIGWVSASFFERCITRENILEIVLAGKTGTLGIREEGIADSDIRKAKHLLSAFGLKQQMRYPYDLLSKGQKQKVLLARAMMSEKRILILDEPCEGLDILSKQKVLQALEKLCKTQSTTLIYVTHHIDEIRPFFDKALLLKQGQIHSKGDIAQILTSDNLSAYFGIPTSVKQLEGYWSVHLNMEEYHMDGTPIAKEGGRQDD